MTESSRDRKETFVVLNKNTNEFKQVGKQCLKEYTSIDLESVLALTTYIKDLQELENDNDYKEHNNGCNYFLVDEFIKYAIYHIEKNGYNKETIAYSILERMLKCELYKNHKYDDKVEVVKQWLLNNPSHSEYSNNLKVLVEETILEHKDVKLLASGVSVALKELNSKIELVNEYVGEVGDKVEININNVRLLYTKHSNYYKGDDSYVYSIVDVEGHTYIYTTTKDMYNAKKIMATIKEHKEYKEIKQTIITRAKEI